MSGSLEGRLGDCRATRPGRSGRQRRRTGRWFDGVRVLVGAGTPFPISWARAGAGRQPVLGARRGNSEDEDEGAGEPRKAPAGPMVCDFIVFATELGRGAVGHGRRFAPGGRGSRAMASRVWHPSSLASRNSAVAVTCSIRARVAAVVAPPSEVWGRVRLGRAFLSLLHDGQRRRWRA